jgi:DNA invertase Pin-like site-specific DNA recombinase
LFNVLAMVPEFEFELISSRIPEGMEIAKAKGRLRGRQSKLKPSRAKHPLELTYTASRTRRTLRSICDMCNRTQIN